jgi:hypothetical protein
MKYPIGQLVCVKADIQAYTTCSVFTVIGSLNNDPDSPPTYVAEFSGYISSNGEHKPDAYIPEFGSGEWSELIRRLLESSLCSLEEAFQEQKRLEAIKDILDRQFTWVRNQVKEKLDQAALLVKEAHGLTKPFDKHLSWLQPECKELVTALEEARVRT